MSRRHSAEKREIIPDAKYGDVVVAKFMNTIMYEGKKSVAETIVYGAFELIEGKTKQAAIGVFEQALENVMPSIEVRSRRVGGATYRCRSRCAPIAARRSASAGSSRPRANATKKPWWSGFRPNSLTHRIIGGTP